MKRSLDEDEESISSDDKRSRNDEVDDLETRVKKNDIEVIQSIKNKYEQSSEKITQELQRAKEKYLVNYLKKVIEKLPVSQTIIDMSTEMGEGYDGYLKMYSLAKTCVHSDMKIKKLIAYDSVINMATNVFSKVVHDKIVSPYFKDVIPQNRLDKAFQVYQESLRSEANADSTSTELHCIAYIIQSDIEQRGSLKLPNPAFNKVTEHLKAMSKYIMQVISDMVLNMGKPCEPPFRPSKDAPEGEREYETIPKTRGSTSSNPKNDKKLH